MWWRPRGHEGAQCNLIAVSEERSQRLNPGPEWRSASGLPAPPPKYQGATVPGPRRQLIRQTTLADARLSTDEKELASPLEGVFQAGQQLC